MRNEIEKLLKEELRILAIRTRAHLKLSQREMAIKFEMSERAYSDIETGKSMCGTLTTILLLSEQEDPYAYLQALKKKFTDLLENDIQLI